MSLKTAWTNGMCRHSEAMAGGTLDCVGGTQSLGAANNYSPQQPQPRIKRSLPLSRFYRNAPESALSEMLVFDHALMSQRIPGWLMNYRWVCIGVAVLHMVAQQHRMCSQSLGYRKTYSPGNFNCYREYIRQHSCYILSSLSQAFQVEL